MSESDKEKTRRILDPHIEPEFYKKKTTLSTGETITFREGYGVLQLLSTEKKFRKAGCMKIGW